MGFSAIDRMLGTFFQCDPDIRICDSEIYLDPKESRKIGIISHGHADHIGRHQRFVATPATAAFLRLRQGADLRGDEIAFGETLQLDRWSVSLHPAGHILGSAMVRITDGSTTLLYTGDARLRPSLTAEPAEVPPCDVLITESTYGSPEWRFPPREETGQRLLDLCRQILARGRTPVLLAYSLGKAQEVMAMLRGSDMRVVVHPFVARIAAIYERMGIDLGVWEQWGGQGTLFGPRTAMSTRARIVIMPPHLQSEIRRVPNAETVALTGWSLHKPWGRTNHALPLSDHCDFDELIELVEMSRASVVYVTHGSNRFARELRARGVRAEFLRGKPQMRLF